MGASLMGEEAMEGLKTYLYVYKCINITICMKKGSKKALWKKIHLFLLLSCKTPQPPPPSRVSVLLYCGCLLMRFLLECV